MYSVYSAVCSAQRACSVYSGVVCVPGVAPLMAAAAGQMRLVAFWIGFNDMDFESGSNGG